MSTSLIYNQLNKVYDNKLKSDSNSIIYIPISYTQPIVTFNSRGSKNSGNKIASGLTCIWVAELPTSGQKGST